MRGFKRKSFEMDDTNRLADYTSKCKFNPIEKSHIIQKKVDVNQQDGRAV